MQADIVKIFKALNKINLIIESKGKLLGSFANKILMFYFILINYVIFKKNIFCNKLM